MIFSVSWARSKFLKFLQWLVAYPCYAWNVSAGVNPPPDQQRRSSLHSKSESWLLILSVLIIDLPPPPQDQQRQSPFHMKVKGDCWSSLHWSLIHLPRINSVDCFHIDHQLTLCWASIASTLIVDLPPRSTVLITSTLIVDCLYIDRYSPQDQQYWALIASTSTIDLPPIPPWINSVDHLCIDCWLSIASALTVDRPPYRFRLSNL